jgi:chorismate mutase
VRRYTSPEEHAFFPEHIPQPILAPLQFPSLLARNDVDVNPQVLSLYIDEIVPAICKPGDDEQHGSSVLADITLLQAISKRIHLGKFVAETKFQEAEGKYRELVLNDDVDGVMELLTNRAVEERVLQVRGGGLVFGAPGGVGVGVFWGGWVGVGDRYGRKAAAQEISPSCHACLMHRSPFYLSTLDDPPPQHTHTRNERAAGQAQGEHVRAGHHGADGGVQGGARRHRRHLPRHRHPPHQGRRGPLPLRARGARAAHAAAGHAVSAAAGGGGMMMTVMVMVMVMVWIAGRNGIPL